MNVYRYGISVNCCYITPALFGIRCLYYCIVYVSFQDIIWKFKFLHDGLNQVEEACDNVTSSISQKQILRFNVMNHTSLATTIPIIKEVILLWLQT